MYNIENLKKIRQMMIDNREAIDGYINMGYWCIDSEFSYDSVEEIRNIKTECGTKMCIAGWCAHFGLLDEEDSDDIYNAIINFSSTISSTRWSRGMSYLFSTEHDNDFDEAIARLDYAIYNNSYDHNHKIFMRDGLNDN